MARRRDLVFGRQPVLELLRSGEPVDKLVLLRGASGESFEAIKAEARRQRVPWLTVPREALDRHCSGNHQGVVAYAADVRFHRVDDLVPWLYEQGRVPFLVVLDGVTDVRNFGAIARTALAAGADGLVIGMRDVSRVGPDAMKASAGALRHLAVCREDSPLRAVEALRAHGLKVYGLAAEGGVLPWALDARDPLAVVAGAEDRGLDAELRGALDGLVCLPMPGEFDSYNVSVAVGMMAYEVARQRAAR
jgi:23S rRNA (guanosine2251-2'-O)-methyltransferase